MKKLIKLQFINLLLLFIPFPISHNSSLHKLEIKFPLKTFLARALYIEITNPDGMTYSNISIPHVPILMS